MYPSGAWKKGRTQGPRAVSGRYIVYRAAAWRSVKSPGKNSSRRRSNWARPGTIRQWFHRAIPYRWQIRLMEYFEGPLEISDRAPEATAAIAKPWIAEAWRRKHPVSS